MNENLVGEQAAGENGMPRGRTFLAAIGCTLAIGVAAALVMIFHLRPPAPVVVQSPPETKEVVKVVYAQNPTPSPPPPPPAPAPEAPAAPPPEEPVAPPPAATVPVSGVWDGVWRRKEYPLPMFRLMSQSGDVVAGTCSPNWLTVVPFQGGVADSDSAEFVVDDQVFRVHVRMTMVGDDKAKVEQFVTDDDWETSLERAMKTARTPQQAAIARAKLERDAQRFRKPVTVGIFTRQSGE